MLWGLYSAIYGEVNISVEKCVEIKGDYVEKQQSCFISVTLKSWSWRKPLDPTTYLEKILILLYNYAYEKNTQTNQFYTHQNAKYTTNHKPVL